MAVHVGVPLGLSFVVAGSAMAKLRVGGPLILREMTVMR